MSIIAKSKDGSNFKPIKAGMKQAVCYSVIDLGTHNHTWQGQVKERRRLLLTFEVLGERIEYEKDGKKIEGIRVVGKEYTLSLGDKAVLRKDLESWRGQKFTAEELKGFDVSVLVGVNAVLNIVHNVVEDRTYANIETINPLMDNMEKVKAENMLISYSVRDDGIRWPENMPEWIVSKIKESKEMKLIENINKSDDSQPPLNSYDVEGAGEMEDENDLLF